MSKPMYRRDGWVLGQCKTCGTLNYVEPHGTTARCKKCRAETEHASIPYSYRDMSGTRLLRTPPKLNPARRKKPGAPSVKTVSLKNFTGKLRINPGVPAGAVVVTGVGSRSNISRKKSKKVAKFMVGSGVPAWKRKGKAMLAKLRRNPADKKPRGFVVSGAGWARAYYSLEAAQKAHTRLVDRGYYGASVVHDYGNRYIVMVPFKS